MTIHGRAGSFVLSAGVRWTFTKGDEMQNRYKGECRTCGAFVAAGAGVWEDGHTFCSEAVAWDRAILHRVAELAGTRIHEHAYFFLEVACQAVHDKLVALVAQAREEYAAGAAARDEAHRADTERIRAGIPAMGERARVRSLAQVVERVTGRRCELSELSDVEVRAVSAELHNRAVRRETPKEEKGKCRRCGGTGAYWIANSSGDYVDGGCWTCNGTGRRVPSR